jgi:hypothetical protein
MRVSGCMHGAHDLIISWIDIDLLPTAACGYQINNLTDVTPPSDKIS